jgi:hypothetical protein
MTPITALFQPVLKPLLVPPFKMENEMSDRIGAQAKLGVGYRTSSIRQAGYTKRI